MVNDLVNINKFIKSLNTNNINSIDLMQQYYYHEIRENIEIYYEVIEKLDNIFSLFNITIEEEERIRKWKNNFLKIITFGFWDWNKKITVQQEELEN
ncbi:hypothetical protein [Spiroplasma ixodetis]|uniref:Uncharacterized protein n=1 Tax=Spiroplasma ixodetis TaxID=2141 RepID=A0ABM8JPY0_9MOLU